MVQKKGRRDRFGNRAESMYDEVDVVQAPSFDRTTVRTELSSDRQPARQSASKAMGQDCSHGFSRSARIVLVQQGREHASWYRSITGLFDAEHWHGSGRAVIAPPAGANDQ